MQTTLIEVSVEIITLLPESTQIILQIIFNEIQKVINHLHANITTECTTI